MMDTRKNFLIQWIRYIKFGLQYYILEKPRGLDFTMRDKSVINQEKGFHGYNKTNENHLRDIFSCLPFEEGLSLIDIGCGKGAVLKEGIKYSFKKLGGIEVSVCWQMLRIIRDMINTTYFIFIILLVRKY